MDHAGGFVGRGGVVGEGDGLERLVAQKSWLA
jgi:hypothetical protein